MVSAGRELDAATPEVTTWRTSAQRAANAVGWRRFWWICGAYAVLLLVIVVLRPLDVDVWSSLAPTSASDTLATLWQVQAGLVTLGFPLLLLLIQLSRDEGVTALRSSEVLARETNARAAMELSAVGLIAAAVFAAWLHSDQAVIAAILLITVPTVVVLLRSYFIALDLHMDRARLRRKSGDLLQEKLRLSMRDLWQIQRANALLLEGLAPIGGKRGYRDPAPDDAQWWSVTAPVSGRITDIDLFGLRSLVEELPAAGDGAAAGVDLRGPARTIDDGGAPRFQLLRFCGDPVTRGDTVLALRRESFGLTANPRLPLARVLRIETGGE